ncbi:hypothetical protein GGI35DRAFT_490969 [Trichoderma velutinum]
MEPTLHKLDANGDTLLTLSNSNQLFVNYRPPWKSALPQHDVLKELQLWTIPTGSTKKSTTGSIQMQLSSKHLQLASDYFTKMMTNDSWKESMPKDGFAFSVSANGWNEEAFLTVMRILHAQTTTLPQIVNLEMLAKIAVIVDYYQCHGATDFFTKAWITKLEEPLPTSFGRSLLLRFLVSWVFSEADTFRQLSQIIIRESIGPANAQDLPIPEAIIDALDKERQDIVSGVILGLHNLKVQFCQGKDGCSLNCSSISLGALMKEAVKNIPEPSYTSPAHGASWNGRHQVSKAEPLSCSLKVKINSIIDEQLDKANGLDLESFIIKKMNQAGKRVISLTPVSIPY